MVGDLGSRWCHYFSHVGREINHVVKYRQMLIKSSERSRSSGINIWKHVERCLALMLRIRDETHAIPLWQLHSILAETHRSPIYCENSWIKHYIWMYNDVHTMTYVTLRYLICTYIDIHIYIYI